MSAAAYPPSVAHHRLFEFRRINRRRRGAVEVYLLRSSLCSDSVRISFQNPLKRAKYRRMVAK